MNLTKLSIYFEDSQSDITLESHGDDTVIICISDMQVNEEESTENNKVVEPYTTSEIYLSVNEAKTFLEALKFIIPRDEVI